MEGLLKAIAIEIALMYVATVLLGPSGVAGGSIAGAVGFGEQVVEDFIVCR